MTSSKMCVTPQPVTSHIKETANIANDDLALLGTETATNVWFICMRIGLCSTHVKHGQCGELGMFTQWLCTHSSRGPTISPHSFTATPRITAQLCWVGDYREITKVLRESVNFSNLPADMKNNQSILVEFSSRHKN